MNIPSNITDYTRVLKQAKTPSKDEFKKIAAIAGIGILIVGFIGFVIFSGMSFLPLQ